MHRLQATFLLSFLAALLVMGASTFGDMSGKVCAFVIAVGMSFPFSRHYDKNTLRTQYAYLASARMCIANPY